MLAPILGLWWWLRGAPLSPEQVAELDAELHFKKLGEHDLN